jgi:hypothetical protein
MLGNLVSYCNWIEKDDDNEGDEEEDEAWVSTCTLYKNRLHLHQWKDFVVHYNTPLSFCYG